MPTPASFPPSSPFPSVRGIGRSPGGAGAGDEGCIATFSADCIAGFSTDERVPLANTDGKSLTLGGGGALKDDIGSKSRGQRFVGALSKLSLISC